MKSTASAQSLSRSNYILQNPLRQGTGTGRIQRSAPSVRGRSQVCVMRTAGSGDGEARPKGRGISPSKALSELRDVSTSTQEARDQKDVQMDAELFESGVDLTCSYEGHCSDLNYKDAANDDWPEIKPEVTLINNEDHISAEALGGAMERLTQVHPSSADAMADRIEELEQWAKQRDNERQRALAALQAAAENRAAEDAERMGKAQARIEQLCDQLSELELARASEAAAHEEAQQSVIDSLAEEKAQLLGELGRVERLREEFQKRHETMKSVVEARTASLQATREELEHATSQFHTQLHAAQDLSDQLIDLEGQKEKLQAALESLAQENADLEEMLFAKGVELEELTKALQEEMERINIEIENKACAYEEELALRDEQKAGLHKEIDTLTGNVRDLSAELDEALTTATLHAENSMRSAKLNQNMQEQMEVLNEQLEGQENTIDSLKLSLSKLHKEHDKLVVEHDSASMEIKTLTSNLEEVIEDRELIRREAKEQVEAVNEQMNMTHQKIEAVTKRMEAEVATAVATQARCEGERERMHKQAAALEEAAVASVTQAAADKVEVIGSARSDVAQAVHLMTSHMTTLREMNSGKAAAKGALTFSDPVETLRISMNAAEEVYDTMLQLQTQFNSHAELAEEQSKNKKDLRNIEEITREIRDLRNMSDENENLNSQVNELKSTLSSLSILLAGDQ
eukprot:CAMPEP_0114245434 /NCGR_PEP_ID=MMETSP0058-20121206/11892_1 /TAXON_ID=36894 /ORGANISM="Pyramimonas parkeae, CCMP726" /LENGTH=689 /DNA_ID=CAMNT_0001358483 /DNA_START=101 /DNA_END=2170 /DNA_ORIENTATION=+